MDNSSSSNNNNTMMNKSTINRNNNNNIPMSTVKPDSNSGSPRHEPEATSAFYRVAAQNLREFYGVKSMTASSLEKTMILLHLAPRRLVVLGLAPRKLSKEVLIYSRQAPEYRPDDDEDERALHEGEVVSCEHFHTDTMETDMNADEGQKEEASEDDANTAEVEKTQEKKETEPRHPIHAALVAGGVQLRPREAKALLHAINISPHRFVRLGLVDMHGERASPGFPQQRGFGGPYHRVPPMDKPRRGPPHGPHLRRGHLHHGSWFGGGMGHSVSLSHARGHPGRHEHFLNSKSGGMHGKRMHSPPCSRSCSPMHRGPGRHGPPRGRHDTGRMRHSVPPPHTRGGLRNHQNPALFSSESEEHSVPRPDFGPWDVNNRHHHDHGHGRRSHRGRLPPPHGPFGRPRPFRNHPHGEGEEERDLVKHRQPPRGCFRSLDIGHRGGVRGCVGSPPPRSRHRCPEQGNERRKVHGRFSGRFPGPGQFGRGHRRGGGGHFEHRKHLEAN